MEETAVFFFGLFRVLVTEAAHDSASSSGHICVRVYLLDRVPHVSSPYIHTYLMEAPDDDLTGSLLDTNTHCLSLMNLQLLELSPPQVLQRGHFLSSTRLLVSMGVLDQVQHRVRRGGPLQGPDL